MQAGIHEPRGAGPPGGARFPATVGPGRGAAAPRRRQHQRIIRHPGSAAAAAVDFMRTCPGRAGAPGATRPSRRGKEHGHDRRGTQTGAEGPEAARDRRGGHSGVRDRAVGRVARAAWRRGRLRDGCREPRGHPEHRLGDGHGGSGGDGAGRQPGVRPGQGAVRRLQLGGEAGPAARADRPAELPGAARQRDGEPGVGARARPDGAGRPADPAGEPGQREGERARGAGGLDELAADHAARRLAGEEGHPRSEHVRHGEDDRRRRRGEGRAGARGREAGGGADQR